MSFNSHVRQILINVKSKSNDPVFTSFAKAISTQLRAPYRAKYTPEQTVNQLKTAFDLAKQKQPEELLLDIIDNISAIIAYQCSLKEQDLWMADMIRRGLYKPDEELLEILKEDGRYRYTEEDEE